MKMKHLGVALLALLSIATFSHSGFAQSMKTVTMVRTTGSIGMVPLEFSVNRGFFKKQGLDVQLITVRQSDVIIAATVAGELNFMDIIPTAILASVRGLPIRTIAVVLKRAPYVLIGQPNLRSAAELKGKKIGVSSVGGMSAYLVREILMRNGLNPDRDVRFSQLVEPRQEARHCSVVPSTPLWWLLRTITHSKIKATAGYS